MSEQGWTHCDVAIPWWYRAARMLGDMRHGIPFVTFWNFRGYRLREAASMTWAVWTIVPQDWGMSRAEIEASPSWRKRSVRTYPRTTDPTQ